MTQRWYPNTTVINITSAQSTVSGEEYASQSSAPSASTLSQTIPADVVNQPYWASASPSGEPNVSAWPTGSGFDASFDFSTLGANLSVVSSGGNGTPFRNIGGPNTDDLATSLVTTWSSSWSSTTGAGIKTITGSADAYNVTPGSTHRAVICITATNTSMHNTDTMAIDVGANTWFEGPFSAAAAAVPYSTPYPQILAH